MTLHPSTASKTRVARVVVLLSPLVVIAIGYLVATVSKRSLDSGMAWLPPMIIYWLSLVLAIAWMRGLSAFRTWLQPSKGAWGWHLLSLVNPAMIAIPSVLFFESFAELPLWRIVAWLLIVTLNPVVEEGYWRATLMDAAQTWPGLAAIGYSAIWFGLSHPLIIGINIDLVAGFTGFMGAFVNGLIWSVVYYQTGSLRWGIGSHIVANMFSIAIFLGLIHIGLG
jgi:hypothetical protein